MSKLKYSSEQLYDEIYVECSISCTKCKNNGSVHMVDDYEAAEIFFRGGWRRTENYLYCPECSKKYLKI